MTDSPHGMRCFKRPDSVKPNDTWFKHWEAQFHTDSKTLATPVLESLGHLMPLLMCGEQSAALVFNREANRSESQRSAQLFSEIEADEVVHDDALQAIYADLPVSPHEAAVKRRAKRFYLALGSTDAPPEELFAGIEHLDSCVCSIMSAVEKSKLGDHHPYAHIIQRIKLDEARHVGISRQHLKWLGSDPKLTAESGHEIRARFIELIRPDTDHWEALGVDWDKLEKQIFRS